MKLAGRFDTEVLPVDRHSPYLVEHAYEAALAVLTHARDVLRLGRVYGIVAGGNTRSIHLLEKLGLRYEKTVRLPDDDEDVRLYRLCFDAARDG